MYREERPQQNRERERAEEQDDSIHRGRYRGVVILTQPAGHERNQRQPEQQMEIGPQRRAVDPIRRLQHVVVIVPVDPQEHEAQNVAQK